MGSQTLEILRQGVLASLTGGWFYDPHQNVFCNAVHLYIWLFLLFLPFIIYMYFPTTIATWAIYCTLMAIIITFFKFINLVLHSMYDKARTMSDTDLKKTKTPRETSGDEDAGIEMQILGAAEVVETPPVDVSSRTSVEHHSDEISCANSAISIDYQEQITSTIDLKVDVHRKNSSESSDSTGLYTKNTAHSSVVQTHCAEVCATATHKRSLSTPNQPKVSENSDNQAKDNHPNENDPEANNKYDVIDETKDKKSATLRRHQYKSKRKEKFMNNKLQRQNSLDSEKIGMGIVFSGDNRSSQLQRHLSSDDQNNKSNTSLFHNNRYDHHLQLQNMDPGMYLEHNYTKSALQLAMENIPGETMSKIFLMQQSTPIRRDSNSTMSALQLPTAAGASSSSVSKSRRHSNTNHNVGGRPLPRSLTSVRRIKSAALETCSPSSISNLAPPHPNSVEVIGGQTLRNPQHTVIPPPSKFLSRNPHLNLFPKGSSNIANNPTNDPVYPIAEQADESTPVKNVESVENFEPNSDSDNRDEDNGDDEDDDDEDIEDANGASEDESIHHVHPQNEQTTTTDTESDLEQPQLQSTDSDTENNGSRSPLLEARNRVPLVIVEKNKSDNNSKSVKHSDNNSVEKDVNIDDSPTNSKFEENCGPSSSDWEQASASSKDLLITKDKSKTQDKWFDFIYDSTNDNENLILEEQIAEKVEPNSDTTTTGTVTSVTLARNLGAIPKTSSSRITNRRLSAEENYPSSNKHYNRKLSQRLSAERIPENSAAPLITFINYRSEVPIIPPIYLPGNNTLSEQQTSSFTYRQRSNTIYDRNNLRQIPCRLRTSRNKHLIISMEPNSSFRPEDNNNCNFCLETSDGNSSSGNRPSFHDQADVPIKFFVDDHDNWMQYTTLETALKERRALSRDSNAATSIIDKILPPTEYSLSSAPSAIDVVPRSIFGEPQIRPKRYYKFPINFFCRKELKISMNRLQLLALFDRDTNWFQVFLAIALSTMVSILGSIVLYLKFYEDLYAFIFCFVIAGSQYSLLKSVQPDAASPIHGFNKTVTYSRPIYFCLCSSLLLGAHHFFHQYQQQQHLQIILFGYQVAIFDFLYIIQSVLSIVILLFPLLFSLGLFPQINTFTMYFLEQIDMHIFGSNAACSLLSAFLSVIRSIMAFFMLYGPAYGGLSESKGTQHLLFSMFCAFLITLSYHLSRCASDFTYIWAIIKSNLIFHPDDDDKDDSKLSNQTDSDEKNNQNDADKGTEEDPKDLKEEEEDQNKELDDPLPKKLQSTVTARLKNDAVVCVVLALIIFSLHCSTIFTVLQPDINYVLHTGACILGFLIHYIVPQLRKHLPWLCIAKPILKSKEFGQFEVQNLSKIMWFESTYVCFCFFERNILYPLIFLSALTADSSAITTKFGLRMGTVLIVICGLKCVRNSYSDIGSQYIILLFSVLLFRLDYKMSSETFVIDYFCISILYKKISEFLLKLQFVVTYIAPWQITWGSAFHAFAQPFSVPHSAMLFLQTAISAILSTPLNPFLGSAIFLTSYVRPIKFWERDYNTRRIDHSNTRLSSQLERDLGADDNNLNSIFYEHLTRSLQHSLCGDLLMGRWGNVSQGDCFVLASDYLNCLVHIIELGNGLCTFQMRGLEFRGTYCQQREVEAISEEVEENIGCCCCTVGHLPRLLSANAMFTTRWLAWQVMASKYVLEGYSISDNSATATLQVFEFRKVLISYYVKSIIYYTIRSPKLMEWLQSKIIEDALEHTLDRQFVDLDPVFNHNLDDDYDFRSAGITRTSFWSNYGDWIQFCCEKRREQNQQTGDNQKASPKTGTTSKATEEPANQTPVKNDVKPPEPPSTTDDASTTPASSFATPLPPASTATSNSINSGRESVVVSLCMALALLARRTLATASHSSLSGVEFFLHGLHALFKGDFRITSTRDEWVFADMELLHGVVAPAVRMSLKLHQDHFLCPDEYDDYNALYTAIDFHTKELVISHEADPLWRNAVLRGTPNLLALRHVMDDGSDEYRVIRLSKRFLSFRVIKLNRECVRGLWAGQQQELIYLRNRNPERGSIQNAKQALRNIINSSCDQPIGYPIYVSPLTTSYAETNPQLCRIIGGEITLEKIQQMIISFWNRVRQRCREGCSSGSAIVDGDMVEIQYCNTPTPHNTLSGTAGTLSYGSQNMSLSGAANRGSLASINKPTSSTLLAGFLYRERDLERDSLRDRNIMKRNISSNSKDRIDRAMAASKRESFKEAIGGGGGCSNNSSLKQQESLESTSGNPKSNTSSTMNITTTTPYNNSVMFSLSKMNLDEEIEKCDNTGCIKDKEKTPAEADQPTNVYINAPPVIGLNKKVIIVDATQVYDCLDLGRRIDVVWPNEQYRSCGGRSSWKEWQPEEGRVGNVVHYWQPNHPDPHFRSNVNRTILLVKIGERCVPISEKGVKEYNTIGLNSTKLEDKETTPEETECSNKTDEKTGTE